MITLHLKILTPLINYPNLFYYFCYRKDYAPSHCNAQMDK